MAPKKSILSASKKAVDPTLDALFASSLGPVEPRAKPKYEKLIEAKPRPAPASTVKPLTEEEKAAAEDDEEDEEEDDDDDDEEEEEEDEAAEEIAPPKPKASKRKRKGDDDDDDLEGRYFDKLTREADGPEKRVKRAKGEGEDKAYEEADEEMVDADDKEDSDADSDSKPVHESLLNKTTDDDATGEADHGKVEQDVEKAARTVFLSNVSIKAVTDKAAKKTLIAHLECINGVKVESKKSKKKAKKEAEKKDDKADKAEMKNDEPIVESIRFRSVPFASAALPKRAAYITGATMGATAQSTNAYVVYATAAQARLAVKNLNGTVVLDRHLRADSVAHPSPVDHRRCVFVGNLGFVDDETVLAENPESGEGEPKKRNKTPMDVEEGLWRTFGKHAGRVESVRVVRDAATRVGKGFAYVQFYDGTHVEAALLLADKKFPPLLPRALRVSRCKAPHKTARALERVQLRGDPQAKPTSARGKPFHKTPSDQTAYQPKATAEQQTLAGRAAKLLGRQAAATDPVVFEGMRARVGGVKLFKKNKNNKNNKNASNTPGGGGKPLTGRRAERAKNWKGKPARGGGGGE